MLATVPTLALLFFTALPFATAQCGGGGGGGNPSDPWEAPRPIWPEDCINRPIQCCNSVLEPANPSATMILGLFNISPQGLRGYVGLNCSPVTVVGVTNGNCGAIPVCCSDNSHGGALALGCVPIIVQ